MPASRSRGNTIATRCALRRNRRLARPARRRRLMAPIRPLDAAEMTRMQCQKSSRGGGNTAPTYPAGPVALDQPGASCPIPIAASRASTWSAKLCAGVCAVTPNGKRRAERSARAVGSPRLGPPGRSSRSSRESILQRSLPPLSEPDHHPLRQAWRATTLSARPAGDHLEQSAKLTATQTRDANAVNSVEKRWSPPNRRKPSWTKIRG
jgi:hypothetical protein